MLLNKANKITQRNLINKKQVKIINFNKQLNAIFRNTFTKSFARILISMDCFHSTDQIYRNYNPLSTISTPTAGEDMEGTREIAKIWKIYTESLNIVYNARGLSTLQPSSRRTKNLPRIHGRREHTTDMWKLPMSSLSHTLSCRGYVEDSLVSWAEVEERQEEGASFDYMFTSFLLLIRNLAP